MIVGSHHNILIPPLDGFRSSSRRFKGLRLIHTHLSDEELTTDDLTDLALLRLDLVCAVTAGEDGLPGAAHTAHLIPENPEGRYWLLLDPRRPSEMDLDFTAFIGALEAEFAKRQTARKVEAVDRAILVRVETRSMSDGEASVAELRELCRTAGVEVFDTLIQHRSEVDPRFLIGKGKLSDLVIRAMQMDANLLIFDHELTAAQIRSIADSTDLKVIDRTQVILDIFAKRAHSREGKIQVELAQLKYRLPRLTQQDAGLSRLTGGIGGTGPGETKLEVDRRRLRDRIHHLEKDLKNIEKARGQRRSRRSRAGLPVVSIVGYTNAGKSTLLNALTKSDVLVEDRLFATLDPKSSRLRFPRDTEAVITDTVGFIRDAAEGACRRFPGHPRRAPGGRHPPPRDRRGKPRLRGADCRRRQDPSGPGPDRQTHPPGLQQGGSGRGPRLHRQPLPPFRCHRHLRPRPGNPPAADGEAGGHDRDDLPPPRRLVLFGKPGRGNRGMRMPPAKMEPLRRAASPVSLFPELVLLRTVMVWSHRVFRVFRNGIHMLKTDDRGPEKGTLPGCPAPPNDRTPREGARIDPLRRAGGPESS